MDLDGTNLYGAQLYGADLSDASLMEAGLAYVRISDAHLNSARLMSADLHGAHLNATNLSGADLTACNLIGAQLAGAELGGAELHFAVMDVLTILAEAILTSSTRLADVVWNNVPLTRIHWDSLKEIGDEGVARNPRDSNGKVKSKNLRRHDYEKAARAYRQLAVVLRDQGLNEFADRFVYRAQVLQRQVLRRRRSLPRWAFSWMLAILAGYGYRLRNILLAYGLVLFVFAAVYFAVGLPVPPHTTVTTAQALANAFQVSLTAIHGRVFFEQFGIGSALAWVAAVESVVGIVIEGVFVAMLVQRFFVR